MLDSQKKKCKLVALELSKHMNYEGYKKLTNYQQGKLIGSLLRNVENKNKLSIHSLKVLNKKGLY